MALLKEYMKKKRLVFNTQVISFSNIFVLFLGEYFPSASIQSDGDFL